jgi:hypothetical protein
MRSARGVSSVFSHSPEETMSPLVGGGRMWERVGVAGEKVGFGCAFDRGNGGDRDRAFAGWERGGIEVEYQSPERSVHGREGFDWFQGAAIGEVECGFGCDFPIDAGSADPHFRADGDGAPYVAAFGGRGEARAHLADHRERAFGGYLDGHARVAACDFHRAGFECADAGEAGGVTGKEFRLAEDFDEAGAVDGEGRGGWFVGGSVEFQWDHRGFAEAEFAFLGEEAGRGREGGCGEKEEKAEGK